MGFSPNPFLRSSGELVVVVVAVVAGLVVSHFSEIIAIG